MKVSVAHMPITRFVMRIAPRRTDEVLRLITYLTIGVFVSLENLLSIALFARQHTIPYIAYIAVAQEISILCSFLLNDRFTFHSLTTARRPWYLRCLRFHGVAAGGGIAIVSIATVMHHFFHLAPLIAQVIAIGMSTGFNFVAHRFWTYRSPQAAHTRNLAPVTITERAVEG